MPLTFEQKIELYRAGQFSCPLPHPVTRAAKVMAVWTEKSWIAWIDKMGKWLLPKGE